VAAPSTDAGRVERTAQLEFRRRVRAVDRRHDAPALVGTTRIGHSGNLYGMRARRATAHELGSALQSLR
jgi:hypothetical protein